MFQLSNWSISRRLFALSGLALVCLAAVGALALHGLSTASTHLNEVVKSGQMLKNHAYANMLHDGIRGDVLSIIVTDEQAARDELFQGLVDHTNELRNFVAGNQELVKEIDALASEKLGGSLGEVLPALEGYVTDARKIGEVAKNDPAKARAELAAFERSFVSPEEPMEAFADEILAYSAEAQSEADASLASSRRDALLGGTVALALLFGFEIGRAHV